MGWTMIDKGLTFDRRSLIHVEADARMDSYQAQDGTNRKALNLVMRRFYHERSPTSAID